MSAEEILVRVLAQVWPLLPYMGAAAAVTAAALLALQLLSRGLWVDRPRFRWLGLFYSLSGLGALCLACAWLKLVLLLAMLFSARPLSAAQYLLAAVPGALYVLLPRRPLRLPVRLFWTALELAGLLSCNTLCGFIRETGAPARYWAVYGALSVFLALLGTFVFLGELDDVSAERSALLEREREEPGKAE